MCHIGVLVAAVGPGHALKATVKVENGDWKAVKSFCETTSSQQDSAEREREKCTDHTGGVLRQSNKPRGGACGVPACISMMIGWRNQPEIGPGHGMERFTGTMDDGISVPIVPTNGVQRNIVGF